jgi:hypothetical protein
MTIYRAARPPTPHPLTVASLVASGVQDDATAARWLQARTRYALASRRRNLRQMTLAATELADLGAQIGREIASARGLSLTAAATRPPAVPPAPRPTPIQAATAALFPDPYAGVHEIDLSRTNRGRVAALAAALLGGKAPR